MCPAGRGKGIFRRFPFDSDWIATGEDVGLGGVGWGGSLGRERAKSWHGGRSQAKQGGGNPTGGKGVGEGGLRETPEWGEARGKRSPGGKGKVHWSEWGGGRT